MKQWSDKNSEFGGVPAFDKMSPEFVKQCSKVEISLNDCDKIANNLDAPTFENTIEEMERSGKLLSDVYPYTEFYQVICQHLNLEKYKEN